MELHNMMHDIDTPVLGVCNKNLMAVMERPDVLFCHVWVRFGGRTIQNQKTSRPAYNVNVVGDEEDNPTSAGPREDDGVT